MLSWIGFQSFTCDVFVNLFYVVVYATMRNLSKGEALVEAAGRTLGRTLEIKQLDVCDEDSIKACVDSLPERRVDILSQCTQFVSHKLQSQFFMNIYSAAHAYFPRT